MKDAYQIRIESETGREVIKAWLRCAMCDGIGSSQFESPCSACAGFGQIRAYVYSDCWHDTESDDCQEEGCTICEAGECEEKRKPFDALCIRCAAIRDDSRRTYEGAKLAGWIEGV